MNKIDLVSQEQFGLIKKIISRLNSAPIVLETTKSQTPGVRSQAPLKKTQCRRSKSKKGYKNSFEISGGKAQ